MKMKADAVIVGTGVGGLFSALNLPRDKKIIMITKSDLESSDSFLAQGGICMLHDEDDYDSYFEDTMKAGHYENRKESVDIMIRSSREIIQDLIGYGVEFQKESDVPEGNSAEEGNQEKGREPETDKPLEEIYAFTREGAHSRPRILFHEDVTGKEITSKLLAQVKKLANVEIYEYTTMTDIIVEDGVCRGIYAKDQNGQELEIYADNTIWASGGIGGRYQHSTNFPHLTGDALDISEKHGIRLEHLDFNLYFLFLLKEWKTALKNEELWVYLGIIGASMAAITGNILHIYGNIFRAFRYASFQVASVITTTGFCTADYDRWPELSKMILMSLMFVGACASSTGGGIKVSRLIILWKSVRQEVRKILHPNAVTVIRVNGRKIGQDTLRNVNIYLACYVLILVVSTLLVSIDNFDFATSFSGVLTTLSNVGPGISQVGPVMNFHKFSVLSKLVFCFDMLAGRLEIFPYLLLFSPDLWRRRF